MTDMGNTTNTINDTNITNGSLIVPYQIVEYF